MARREPISQYSTELIGIIISDSGMPEDADADVTLTIVRESDNEVLVLDAIATHEPAPTPALLGHYSYSMTPLITNQKGNYTITWKYTLGGDPREFPYQFMVVTPQPYWDSLNAKQKGVIENIYFKLSDGFDSTIGGPYLWELPQSNFGYETIARLTIIDGMNAINFEGPKAFQQPYSFGPGTRQIGEGWYGLVQQAGFYETLKHLSRSYLEIPQATNVPTAYEDRTRYSEMWMRLAEAEGERLLRQIHMIKRAFAFGVKARAQLVAGGIFPISYLNPARPRWPYVLTRFY